MLVRFFLLHIVPEKYSRRLSESSYFTLLISQWKWNLYSKANYTPPSPSLIARKVVARLNPKEIRWIQNKKDRKNEPFQDTIWLPSAILRSGVVHRHLICYRESHLLILLFLHLIAIFQPGGEKIWKGRATFWYFLVVACYHLRQFYGICMMTAFANLGIYKHAFKSHGRRKESSFSESHLLKSNNNINRIQPKSKNAHKKV